jgi:hypothetical protein
MLPLSKQADRNRSLFKNTRGSVFQIMKLVVHEHFTFPILLLLLLFSLDFDQNKK